jgi:excisionase family DNA binding protein
MADHRNSDAAVTMHPHEYGLLKAAYAVSEATTVLSIGKTALYELVKNGRLKPVKLGRKTLFLASDLARLLEELRGASSAKAA